MLILVGAGIGSVLGMAIWLSSLGSPSPYRRMGFDAIMYGLLGGAAFGAILFAIFKV